MHVEEEEEVILNEVSPGHPEVDRIPVCKLAAHELERCVVQHPRSLASALCGQRMAKEDVIPLLVRHCTRLCANLLGGSRGQRREGSRSRSGEKVANRVKGHVQRRVGKRLDHLVLVKRQARALE